MRGRNYLVRGDRAKKRGVTKTARVAGVPGTKVQDMSHIESWSKVPV